jgi:hypothetical protein
MPLPFESGFALSFTIDNEKIFKFHRKGELRHIRLLLWMKQKKLLIIMVKNYYWLQVDSMISKNRSLCDHKIIRSNLFIIDSMRTNYGTKKLRKTGWILPCDHITAASSFADSLKSNSHKAPNYGVLLMSIHPMPNYHNSFWQSQSLAQKAPRFLFMFNWIYLRKYVDERGEKTQQSRWKLCKIKFHGKLLMPYRRVWELYGD